MLQLSDKAFDYDIEFELKNMTELEMSVPWMESFFLMYINMQIMGATLV